LRPDLQHLVVALEGCRFAVAFSVGLEDHLRHAAELCLNLGDAHHQAAWFSVSPVTSTPSLNLMPSMTFGNWFLPLSLNHFFDAA
jgi:hypothetical protein